MKKMKKTQLDEMQEQKLLKIEHNGCWFAFWGLLAIIFIQILLDHGNAGQNVAGEWIVFMCLCIYMLIACLKNGIWDRRFKPTLKTNAALSAGGAAAVAIFNSVISYVRYHKMAGSIATGIFMFVMTFVICMIMFIITTMIYKKRKEKLEDMDDEA